MKSLSECLLYTFVDSAYLHGRDPCDLALQLCQGGSDIIQFRAKDWPVAKIAETAGRLIRITKRYSVRLVINDYPLVAREVGAEMCHLGQEDFFESGHSSVRELPGRGVSPEIGLSTHAPNQAMRALSAEPAYIAIGPVFSTGTKPTAAPVTLEYVRWAAKNVPIPWFAIGGITPENVREVMAAGARRVCVVSAILNESDVASACQRFKSRMSGGDQKGGH